MTAKLPGSSERTGSKSESHYDLTYHREFHGEMLDAADHYEARARISAESYLTAAERTSRVFEYGCGVGQNIALLPKGAGWDISAAALEACRARGLTVYEEWGNVPREAWDVVLCRHVLEHLEDPLAALRRMRELLVPTGKLVLIVPKEPHYREPLRPDTTQHLFSWNFRAINNLLFRAGFRPVHNAYNYPLGWRAFMPIRRMFGHTAYATVSKLGGTVFRRNGELVIHAVPA